MGVEVDAGVGEGAAEGGDGAGRSTQREGGGPIFRVKGSHAGILRMNGYFSRIGGEMPGAGAGSGGRVLLPTAIVQRWMEAVLMGRSD